MTGQVGPHEVLEAAEAASAMLSAVAVPSGADGSRAEWAAVLGGLQRVVDVASAAQDAAMVALAAIEEEWAEDGTVVERHRAPGHVALDAPALVSGVLTVSAVQAERRVRGAVRVAADGPAGSDTDTGLGGLHRAMAEGRLDAYRASVVADELELAPAEVAAPVVAALGPHFATDDAAGLRRRCRRVLARVSPDLLRQRARRARSESRLERWACEPGVDCWHGTFPSEEAARAWAAVDALAQRYVADGTCAEIGRARAKALTDLVEGSADIRTVVTLVVPAGHDEGDTATAATTRRPGVPVPTPGGPGPDHEPCLSRATDGQPHGDLVEVAGTRAGEPVLVDRGWLREAVAATRVAGRDRAGRPRLVAGDADSGALVDPDGELSTDAYRPGTRLVELVRARDGRCRFPGCHVAARFCDLDHVRPWPAGATRAANLLCLCRRHHRVKQRPGWRVVLAADGVAVWSDPTGRRRSTDPVDVLHALVLPVRPDEPELALRPHGQLVIPDGPHSALEFALEHRRGAYRPAPACRVELNDRPHRGWELAAGGHLPRRRWSVRPPPDDPPF